MGSAFVAIANDATALYWNPAGISRLPGNEMVFIHSAWIADINYDFVGAVFQLKNKGAIGISLISLSTQEMKVRTIDQPEGTGEMFSVAAHPLLFPRCPEPFHKDPAGRVPAVGITC